MPINSILSSSYVTYLPITNLLFIMSSLEVQALHNPTTLDPEKHVINGENADELSPIEEVRLTVTNTDDPSLPVWTFRMWFLGLLSCALLSFLNQFFAYRKEPLVITQITVQVASLPIGQFMAAVLPRTQFKLPGVGSRTFSLNPGPFNMKEHVLISIFANAGSAFGNGSAYAVGIVTIIKVFYGRSISFLAGWLLIITTQVINPLYTLNCLGELFFFFILKSFSKWSLL